MAHAQYAMSQNTWLSGFCDWVAIQFKKWTVDKTNMFLNLYIIFTDKVLNIYAGRCFPFPGARRWIDHVSNTIFVPWYLCPRGITDCTHVDRINPFVTIREFDSYPIFISLYVVFVIWNEKNETMTVNCSFCLLSYKSSSQLFVCARWLHK